MLAQNTRTPFSDPFQLLTLFRYSSTTLRAKGKVRTTIYFFAFLMTIFDCFAIKLMQITAINTINQNITRKTSKHFHLRMVIETNY